MSTPNLDDRCGVCDETRENHGDKNHKFDLYGQLVPIEPRPEPRNTPPEKRRASVAADSTPEDEVRRSFVALVEILAEKDILVAKDIIRIFNESH